MRFRAWIALIAAIALEICGISLLKVFDNAGQGVIGKIVLIILMNASYFLMSLTLREIAVGVAYATWEIVGGIGVLLISFAFFEPHLSTAQYFGIAFGFVGIVCIILGEEHSDSMNSDSMKCGDSISKKSTNAYLAESPCEKSAQSLADSAKNIHKA